MGFKVFICTLIFICKLSSYTGFAQDVPGQIIAKMGFKVFICTLIFICKLSSYTGFAQDVPGQIIAKTLSWLNNKIYLECDEAYQLTQSGNLNVPPESTDIFCNGPCLAETRLVLSCINGVISDFVFYNKATVRDISYALNSACSFTSQRGDFDVERYINNGETSSASSLGNLIGFYALAFFHFGLYINLVTLIILFWENDCK